MKIRNKLIKSFLILAILPVIIAGFLGVMESIKLLKKNTIRHLEIELFSKAEAIGGFLRQVRQDVLYLKENANLKKFIEDGSLQSLEALKQDFLSFSRNHPYYYQVRFIDERGYEKVRVDSDGSHSKIIPSYRLQLKKYRYYFKKSITHPPGTVYTSPMDLNVERGKVEYPPKKVVRFGTPVVDGSGRKRGIVIINLYADYLLAQIRKLVETNGIVFLFDQRGRYLFRYPKDVVSDLPVELKPEFEESHYRDEFERSILSKLLSGEKGTVKDRESIISYVPIYTGDIDSVFWVLGIKYPLRIIFSSTYNLLGYLGIVGIVTVGMSILIAIAMGHYFSGPIMELKRGVEHIGMKDFKHRVGIHTGDEIEELATNFNQMASKLEEYNVKLTRWNESLKDEVDRRTRELESSRRELVRERDKLKNLIQSAAEGIIVANGENKVVMANPAAQKILGLSESEILGRDIMGCHPKPEDVKGILMGEKNQFVGARRWKDRILEISIAILRDEYSKALIGSMMLFRDITEAKKMDEARRELERKIFQAEKLASLGVLSAGIAHEIGNPLAAIKIVVQAMVEEFRESKGFEEYAQRLTREVSRLSAFIKTFSDFAYSHEKKAKECNIEDILREVIFWTKKEAKQHNISIRYLNGRKAQGVRLYIDPYRIQQVFINLIINAIHAMPRGGYVKVSTREIKRPRRGVLISVADTGIGIKEEDIGRIFDPFFTTKSTGTGLGLSVAMKIVQEHQGSIDVISRVGEGTTFKVFLPAKEDSTYEV